MAVYWNAFWALHNSRRVAFGALMPIPVSEILAYCRLCGFHEPVICHEVLRLVQAIDDAWLASEAARREAAGQAPPAQQRH